MFVIFKKSDWIIPFPVCILLTHCRTIGLKGSKTPRTIYSSWDCIVETSRQKRFSHEDTRETPQVSVVREKNQWTDTKRQMSDETWRDRTKWDHSIEDKQEPSFRGDKKKTTTVSREYQKVSEKIGDWI